MSKTMIVLWWLVLAHLALTESRVFYIDDRNLQGNDGIDYDNFEQSSRDLDLSFSTGDASNDDNYPLFKRVNPVRPYDIPERRYSEISKDVDRPRGYYKFVKVPEPRPNIEEIIVEPKKYSRFSQTPRERKGEMILELRVMTNNDAI